jgi:hypothetical protein
VHEYDKSSKWLIEHHGDSILRLAGVRGILSWRALQAELVQSRRLPDGMIEARLRRHTKPVRFVLEISTYPYRRLSKQAVDAAALAYLDGGELPEVLTLVLHPGRRAGPTGAVDLASPHGWTRWHVEWKLIELWTIPATELLAANDLGLIPWVPLSKIDGSPEPIFRECRARVDRDAPPGERENLLAVTQFLAGLSYNDSKLFQILGGRKAMIESPVLKELIRDERLETIRRILIARFGPDARSLEPSLDAIANIEKLAELVTLSATSSNLESFKKRLQSGPRKRK